MKTLQPNQMHEAETVKLNYVHKLISAGSCTPTIRAMALDGLWTDRSVYNPTNTLKKKEGRRNPPAEPSTLSVHSWCHFVNKGCVYKEKVSYIGETWMEVRRRSRSLCLPRFLHTLFFDLSAKETNCLMHKEQLVLLGSVFRGGFFLSGTQRWTWDVLFIVQDFLLSLQAWVSEGVRSFSRTRAACLPELGLSKGTEGVKLKFFFFFFFD